jgi:UDP-N-acetyl-D-glucosamine dehydrogenase
MRMTSVTDRFPATHGAYARQLIAPFRACDATVGVVGLGYVGLPPCRNGSALNERSKALKGSRILVLGIAYKKNIDDVRESPAAVIMELLRDRGALLSYSDLHVPRFPKMREHQFDLSSVDLTKEMLAGQDCVVVVTDHDRFDFEAIATHARLVVDTRGRYPMARYNVVKAQPAQ